MDWATIIEGGNMCFTVCHCGKFFSTNAVELQVWEAAKHFSLVRVPFIFPIILG
jgi:hypothetical protein